MRLRALQRDLDPERSAEVDRAVVELEGTVAELRQLAHGVRPSRLDDGLLPALEAVRAATPIPMDLEVSQLPVLDEVRVLSAHRDPDATRDYCTNARMRGLKVIIAGAGMSAALPGFAAAHTDLPVIGVPISGKNLGGLDALLSAAQMPPGVPVGCVAIDGAKNAGLLAVRIINA